MHRDASTDFLAGVVEFAIKAKGMFFIYSEGAPVEDWRGRKGETILNLFGELEGKKQEVLASAILRFLLSGSQGLRATFCDILGQMLGPIGSGNHFATYLEFATESEDLGSGRLDLLIETDEALIGVEIKVWAGFQDNQPEKYVQSLAARASALADLRKVQNYPSYLVVLAPDSRRRQMESEIAQKQSHGLFNYLGAPCKFLTWEALLERFEATEDVSVPGRFLVGELQSYFGEIEGALSNFKALATQLHRWEPKGSRWHRDVVGGLWRLLPGVGSRLGAADTWCGYSLQSEDEDRSVQGWFGFVSKDQFIEPANLHDAELIFQLNQQVPAWASEDRALPRDLKSKNFPHTWIIRFDESWKPVDWRNFLEPLQVLLSGTQD